MALISEWGKRPTIIIHKMLPSALPLPPPLSTRSLSTSQISTTVPDSHQCFFYFFLFFSKTPASFHSRGMVSIPTKGPFSTSGVWRTSRLFQLNSPPLKVAISDLSRSLIYFINSALDPGENLVNRQGVVNWPGSQDRTNYTSFFSFIVFLTNKFQHFH